MDENPCTSCGFVKSIYGQFCNECQHCTLNKRTSESSTDDKGLPTKKGKKKRKILSTLDILISVFVVTPLVVACWRGTWELFDIYADYFPPWPSFIIGTVIQVSFGVFKESFHLLVNKKHKSWICGVFAFIFMKLYTIILNGVTNMHWRGVWILLDEYLRVEYDYDTGGTTMKDWRIVTGFYTISFLIMLAMRCLRNLNSPPFEICLDYGDDMFLFPNMFKVNPTERFSLYVLDTTFSVGVVTNLGIVVWRGLGLIIDVHFYSKDGVWPAWGCMVLGYLMVFIVFLSQRMMKKLCDNLSGIPKLLIADAYMTFAVVAVIFVWKGIWELLYIYFMPENEILSCWISLWVPMAILMIMGCSNSVLARGICLDCEEPDGSCVVFPCNYLKTIFDQEKNDSWFSIWTGVKKIKDQTLYIKDKSNSINVINYHVVNIDDGANDDKNDNVNKNGIP